MFSIYKSVPPPSNSEAQVAEDGKTQQQQQQQDETQLPQTRSHSTPTDGTTEAPSCSSGLAVAQEKHHGQTAKGSLLVVNEPDAARRARLQRVLAEYLPHALVAGSGGGAGAGSGRRGPVGALRVTGHEADKVCDWA